MATFFDSGDVVAQANDRETRDCIIRAVNERAELIAVLHIAKEAILSAAVKVLDKPDREPGEYPNLMQANEHIERTLAKVEGRNNG